MVVDREDHIAMIIAILDKSRDIRGVYSFRKSIFQYSAAKDIKQEEKQLKSPAGNPAGAYGLA